jgi:hypothetical protein
LPARLDPLKTYITEVAKYPMLSPEEERENTRLVYKDKNLDAAEKVAVSNLRLVVKIAMGYYNVYHNILDLIQEGNVGLLHAVQPIQGDQILNLRTILDKGLYIEVHNGLLEPRQSGDDPEPEETLLPVE